MIDYVFGIVALLVCMGLGVTLIVVDQRYRPEHTGYQPNEGENVMPAGFVTALGCAFAVGSLVCLVWFVRQN